MRVLDVRFAAYFLAIFICHSASLNAELRMTYSIRRLVIDADSIVIAEPVESQPGVMPDRYRVLEVLHSAEIKVGDEVRAQASELPELKPSPFFRRDDDEESPDIERALLFIFNPGPDRPATNDGSVRVDIRALSRSGKTLVPQQVMNPGPLYMLTRNGATWDGLVALVRNELPEINRVKAMREIPDAKERNQALLAWVEEHKAEFGGGHFDGDTKGWATFETKLFDWIYQTCIPEDCWRAVEFSVETHSSVWMYSPSFCSPEGRMLLLSKVLDERLANPLRRQAMELLSSSCFWPQRDDYPGIVNATAAEQAQIIENVTPLLRDGDARWRGAAVNCVLAASHPNDHNLRQRISRAAVPELAKMYGKEKDPYVSGQIVHALHQLNDEDFWQELTGNPDGIAVTVSLGNIDQSEVEFWLHTEYPHVVLMQPMTLELKKLDERGEVSESLMLKPQLRSMATGNQTQVIDAHSSVGTLNVPAAEIPHGKWRVSVEGKTMDGKSWRTAPVDMSIPRDE